MLWIIQKNFNNNFDKWINALESNESHYKTLEIVPFSDSLPDVDLGDHKEVLVYGTTTMIKNASKKWNPGTFFNPENFKCSTWIEKYGNNCFNYGGKVWVLKDLIQNCPETCFIRPNNDLKDFSGVVVKKESVLDFYENVKKGDYLFDENLEVYVAPIKHIQKEWRVFIVGGKAITASQYKLKSMIALDQKVEQRVLDFAQSMSDIWCPEKAFVMDICLTLENELKLLELNCFNASGAYLCDLTKIVKSVEDLFKA